MEVFQLAAWAFIGLQALLGLAGGVRQPAPTPPAIVRTVDAPQPILPPERVEDDTVHAR